MPRYLVESATKLRPLQEGDYPQPLAFIVPDALPMNGKDAEFVMEYPDHTVLFTKTSQDGEIVITGQGIVINLTAEDTQDKIGTFHWWLRVTDEDELITIGYGKIQINRID